MADTPETRVLKDINRHLANIDESGAEEAPPEQISIKNMQDIVGNFQSLLDSKLQRIVLTSERAFNQAFGNLQGFNLEQNNAMIAELDNVIDELQINNRLTSAGDDLQFLKEKQRDEEVEINKETNELLEDILEKDGMGGEGGRGGLSGLPLEIIGGLLTAMGLKGLGAKLFSKAGLISLGKVLAKSVFAAFSLKHFFEGFAEDSDNLGKSFSARLVSGLGNMIEALTFGLIDDELIEELGDALRAKVSKAGEDLQAAWDKYVGGAAIGDTIADVFSALSLGTISPEGVKKIGESVDFFVDALGQAIQDSILRKIGFDIDTPEERKVKAKEEKITKAFKLTQATEPELERLFEEAGLSFKKKSALRGLLSGQLALLSPSELKALGKEEGEKRQLDIKQDRAAFIERHKKSLQNKIERQQWLDDRKQKRKDKADLKATEAKATSDRLAKMAQDATAAEREVTKTKKRIEGEGGDTFVDAKAITLGQPDEKTETDDINLLRNGMFGPISPFAQ